jgi:hypothetical protein
VSCGAPNLWLLSIPVPAIRCCGFWRPGVWVLSSFLAGSLLSSSPSRSRAGTLEKELRKKRKNKTKRKKTLRDEQQTRVERLSETEDQTPGGYHPGSQPNQRTGFYTLCTHSSQIFQYKLKRKKKPCISISIYEGRLFVCFVLFGLVPWRLDLRCRSS